MKNCAFTSVLATDNYLGGAIGLYYSLQAVQSQYPFHLLVTDNVSSSVKSKLDEIGILYSIVPLINFDGETNRYETTFNKFHIFSLTQYDTICFIDCDALIKENIDDIFHIAPPGFIILDDVFLSGILILMDPNSKNIEDFLEYKDKGEDESVWNTLYNAKISADLIHYFGKIFHVSSCGYHDIKYWEHFTLEELKPLIDEMCSKKDFYSVELLGRK